MDSKDRFRQLFQDNVHALAMYGRRRGLSGHDVDDFVSSIFEVAWRRIDDVPVGDEAVLWLYGVAFNQLRNSRRTILRAKLLTSRLSTTASMPPPPDPEVPSVDTILNALESLTVQDRELLLLFVGERLTARQVGAVIGCTEVTARSRLFRARTRLAAILELNSMQHESSNGHVDSAATITAANDQRSTSDE